MSQHNGFHQETGVWSVDGGGRMGSSLHGLMYHVEEGRERKRILFDWKVQLWGILSSSNMRRLLETFMTRLQTIFWVDVTNHFRKNKLSFIIENCELNYEIVSRLLKLSI